jgi:hypothetical protein
MNTIVAYNKHHSTALSIGLGLALIFSFTGCQSPAAKGIIADGALGAVERGKVLARSIENGDVITAIQAALGLFRHIESTAFQASKADERYAREIARSYVPKTNAPNLAIRTKSSENKAQPEVVVVDRKTREVISSYKLDNRPDNGQRIKLQNTLMCEYVP